MGLISVFKSLILELDRVHSGAFPWSEEVGIPDFVTADNGMPRLFTQGSKVALSQLSEVLYKSRVPSALKIELDEYVKITRQAVADMHASEEFFGFDERDLDVCITRLKDLIERKLALVGLEYTHYFPAWTLGMEKESPFSLGLVTFFNRLDWIDSVDFHQNTKDNYLNQQADNNRWKEIVREALQRPHGDSPIEGLANPVYSVISKCPAIVKVTVRGYEEKFSRKFARLIVKTALDAISLGFGASEFFQQQAIHEERLPPVGTHVLLETEGFLWHPGITLGQRISSLSPNKVKRTLVELAQVLPAFEAILEGLLDPSTHNHPKLANRWATALDWFGEGCREPSDAIAVAKLATCLDVLACGGKSKGILKMVAHLTGTEETTQVVNGNRPRTLTQLVNDIYDSGRSKILHGTHYDRLKSFNVERQQAAYLARIVLIETAVRLQNYDGSDEDKAFRTI